MNSKTRLLLLAASALIAAATFAVAAHHRRQPTLLPNVADATGRTTLPNGWRLTPAGHTIPLPGDMPLGMSLTPDGRYLLVNTGGFHDHSVNVIDLKTETLAQSVNVYRNWGGLSTDRAGANVYVAGAGNAGANYAVDMIKQGISASDAANLSKPVYRLTFADGKLTLVQGVDIDGVGAGRFMGGLLCGPAGSLYALNINADTVYKLAGSPMHVVAQAKVGYRPGAVVLSPDGAVLAVSNWGDRSVSLLDAATLKETARVAVGSHPNALLYGRDGRLYVANAGSNSVSVLAGERVLETIVTSLEAKAPVGSTPDALALSPDGTRLYVANADNNAVAVIDTSRYDRARGQSESRVLGFIPTGWYPSALAVSQDGRKLYIGIGKGLKFRANYPGVVNNRPRRRTGRPAYDYIGSVLSGAVAVVDLPDARGLAAYTRQTRENLPLPLSTQVDRRQVEDVTHNAFAHIKHVLYIIRENRTYDQVFGDIPGGNGDPNLTMYGEQVTPNAHALARKTVLLDNLYCSGEVSEDGHEWCNAAYATDFREKGWINSYSGRGEPDADGRLTQSPAGYLWDNCARHGLSYRSYGEFTGYTASLGSKPVYTGHPTLNGHACQAWWEMDSQKDARDFDYAGVFIRELNEAEKTGEWPRYMVMSLGEDHTSGLSPGAFTPSSCVAANDVGLGKIVEAISHSRFWPETAIFVIEDDAQDGPDHVDAHRTEGLVISPYTKRGSIDSTLYTTSGMVRTIELILGLPPMTQYDTHATPLYNAFTGQPDLTPYTCLPARIDLAARNPKAGEAARQSARLDFSQHDRADPVVLNRLLWEDAKPGIPMPAPVRSALLTR